MVSASGKWKILQNNEWFLAVKGYSELSRHNLPFGVQPPFLPPG